MAQQTVNIGATPNDPSADNIRDGGDKINDNFTELYATHNDALIAALVALSTAADKGLYFSGSNVPATFDLGAAARTFLGTPSSANLAALLSDEMGTNNVLFGSTGTTAPTPTAQTGTFTSVSAALSYLRVGDWCFWDATITITTNGTAAGFIILPMPFTCGTQAGSVSGIRSDNGVAVGGYVVASNNIARLWLATGAYPGATSGTIICGGKFKI